MHMVDIIRKKRGGGELTDAEIDAVVHGCVSGEIPDYQLSALMMARMAAFSHALCRHTTLTSRPMTSTPLSAHTSGPLSSRMKPSGRMAA